MNETLSGERTLLAAWLPVAGIGVALWAVLPKYSGPTPGLTVAPGRETTDHIIPALLVLAASLTSLAYARRASRRGVLAGAGLAVLLAGLWMAATHFPLVTQAIDGGAPWPATIYHTTAAVAVLGFGLLWVGLSWRGLGIQPADATAATAATSASSSLKR